MRYYDIQITDSGGKMLARYTSLFANGRPNPGALRVELDVPGTYFTAPISQALVRIHGVPLSDISGANGLNSMTCKVYAGMSKGLPLANPAQAGLILQGMVFQAFGNWVGTDMWLELVVTANGGSTEDPSNLVLIWQKGQPLGPAIASALSTAYPARPAPQVNVSDSLVKAEDVAGAYASLEQFAQMLYQTSRSIIKDPAYLGVQITDQQGQLVVFDSTAAAATLGGSTAAAPRSINFLDFIGQPTWFQPNCIAFNVVMRSDLNVGDFVRLPASPVTVVANSAPQARNSSAVQGVYQVDLVRHVGDSRQADALSWVTTIQAHTAGSDTPLAYPSFK